MEYKRLKRLTNLIDEYHWYKELGLIVFIPYRNCKVETDLAEDYSACIDCKWLDCLSGDCENPNDCENNKKEVKSFVCGIDKAKMYSPRSINRSSFKKDIMNRCDRPMRSIAEGCEHYINVYNTDEHNSCLKAMGL